MSLNRNSLPFLACCLAATILFFISLDNGFFWDTQQLGSRHASHFYSNGFGEILLPDDMDSGHIPGFGFYLAIAWKAGGRNLAVSHIAMLPFILGILFQLSRLSGRFFSSKWAGWAVLLIFSDPTLLSQITLISPDVPLAFLFLLALNSILDNRKATLSAAIIGLFLISMRGMMVSFSLLLADLYINTEWKSGKKSIFRHLAKRSLIYLPALLVFAAYNGYHYYIKGWIGFHENSPWAGSFEAAGFSGIIRNILILGWRLADFGRIGIWIIFAYLICRYKSLLLGNMEIRIPAIVFLLLLVILSASMVWATNLTGHRYLIPVYLTFSLLTAYLLLNCLPDGSLRHLLISAWMISLITGNLWIYPERISQGWDSTLAHLPYYKVRERAIGYLREESVDFARVGSFFPNLGTMDNFSLNGDSSKFAGFNGNNDYVFYSNVFNVSDEELNILHKDYSEVARFSKCRVYTSILKRENP